MQQLGTVSPSQVAKTLAHLSFNSLGSQMLLSVSYVSKISHGECLEGLIFVGNVPNALLNLLKHQVEQTRKIIN